ncbi:MAG: DUF3887 domain-containing protein [bacterium]|nr:DUF3887 domain-containing protein [bacterium]
MRSKIFFIILLVFLVGLTACKSGDNQFERDARKFVDQLANGQFEEAFGTFDQTMSGALPLEKLEEVWDRLQDQTGNFQKQLSTRRETYTEYEIVFVTCQFDNGKMDVKVVFNQQKQVAGLFFVPTKIE